MQGSSRLELRLSKRKGDAGASVLRGAALGQSGGRKLPGALLFSLRTAAAGLVSDVHEITVWPTKSDVEALPIPIPILFQSAALPKADA